MKVKKVLSLALAIVMIFTMIPAQLILSSANKKGLPEANLGSALQYNLKVSQESGKTGGNAAYNGLIKVEFQAKVDYTNVPEDDRAIATLGQVFSFDTAVLAPVSSASGSAKGTSTLDTAKTNAGSAPNYAWSKAQAGNNIALLAENVLDENEDTFKYGLNNSAISYNDSTGRMYAEIVCFNSDGCVWLEGEMQTVAYMYLKPVEGATFAQIYNAIKLVTEDELLSTTDGCLAPSMEEESYASATTEGARFVANTGMTNALPDDPTPSTKVKITFNWKAVEEGTVVDKTTGAVEYEEGAPVTAPANSENDYSTAEYDYEFTGWSPALAEGATATEDTVYTAQYQPKAVDKEALDTEYQADKGLVQEDYEEKVPGAWNALQDALAEAERVLGDQTASKVDVANALAAIEAAMANLTPKTPQASYNVTFKWQNGAKSDTTPYDEGATVQAPEGSEAGYVSADGRTKYTFTGWKDDATGTTYGTAARIPAVAGEASYTAQYDSEDVIVKITFNWANAEGPQTTIVDKVYGDAVSLQDAPVVSYYFSADGDTKYEFTGWSPATFAAATEPATYTAQFNEIPQYADYTAVDAAIARANARQQEDEYQDKYTSESIKALADAINAVVRALPQSQQTTVDNMAGAIDAAIDGLTVKDVTLTFYTHEKPADTTGGIVQVYKYGDAVTAPEVQGYEEGGFQYSFNGWNKDVPTVAKSDDSFTAQYQREGNASTAELQQAVNNAIAKREDGNWTDTSKANLNAVLEEAAPYLVPGAEFPASQQGAINDLTARVNAAADALTPAGATQFDVTFNWKVDGGQDASDTVKYNNGALPTAPTGSENGYETTDYTYTFMRWEPSIIAVDGANQVYNAVYNEPQPKSADTSALRQAIADAQAKMAEDNYEDKYTPGSREALENALQNGQTVLNSNPLPSQIGAVDQATQAINDALSGMAKNQFTLVFYTHENPNGIEQIKEYGDTITPPPINDYSETDYDYTANGWDPQVPATATSNGEYYAQYTQGPLKTADYRYNDIYSALAQAVVDTPNADKVYTQNYLAGVQSALDNNVQPGLPASQQQAVNDATQALANAISDPQYINYTIRFINEGQVISTSNTYHYDDTVTVPANPTKDPTPAKTFEFNGWTPEVTKVTGNQDYTATYTEKDRKYTVTFSYHGGESTEAVKFGVTPSTDIAPNVPNYYEGGFKYTFDHWTPDFAPVEGPQTYTAVYSQEQMPAVTVTFRYATSLEDVKDGHLTDVQQTVPYGDMPVIPTPEEFTDGDTTYKFDGWDNDVVAATEDAIYTAIYTPVSEFEPDMSEIEELVARYNQMVKTGKYNKDDLKAVKAYIDEIYDTTFTSQDEVNEMARTLKVLEDSVRRIDVEKKETKKRESYSRRYSRTARTGDNATLIVMSVILVSSLGIAFISLKKRRENI